jgi:hypothetical protein
VSNGAGGIFAGVATYYPSSRFAGQPLYCDQYLSGGLRYSEDTTPWAAFDVTWYEEGRIACGDHVILVFADGAVLEVIALDAGRFYSGNYWVQDWPELPIVADLPEHLRPDDRMAWLVRGIIVRAEVKGGRRIDSE